MRGNKDAHTARLEGCERLNTVSWCDWNDLKALWKRWSVDMHIDPHLLVSSKGGNQKRDEQPISNRKQEDQPTINNKQGAINQPAPG
jgi:hypothetical protein